MCCYVLEIILGIEIKSDSETENQTHTDSDIISISDDSPSDNIQRKHNFNSEQSTSRSSQETLYPKFFQITTLDQGNTEATISPTIKYRRPTIKVNLTRTTSHSSRIFPNSGSGDDEPLQQEDKLIYNTESHKPSYPAGDSFNINTDSNYSAQVAENYTYLYEDTLSSQSKSKNDIGVSTKNSTGRSSQETIDPELFQTITLDQDNTETTISSTIKYRRPTIKVNVTRTTSHSSRIFPNSGSGDNELLQQETKLMNNNNNESHKQVAENYTNLPEDTLNSQSKSKNVIGSAVRKLLYSKESREENNSMMPTEIQNVPPMMINFLKSTGSNTYFNGTENNITTEKSSSNPYLLSNEGLLIKSDIQPNNNNIRIDDNINDTMIMKEINFPQTILDNSRDKKYNYSEIRLDVDEKSKNETIENAYRGVNTSENSVAILKDFSNDHIGIDNADLLVELGYIDLVDVHANEEPPESNTFHTGMNSFNNSLSGFHSGEVEDNTNSSFTLSDSVVLHVHGELNQEEKNRVGEGTSNAKNYNNSNSDIDDHVVDKISNPDFEKQFKSRVVKKQTNNKWNRKLKLENAFKNII